jgi:hypothetical protein
MELAYENELEIYAGGSHAVAKVAHIWQRRDHPALQVGGMNGVIPKHGKREVIT